MRFRAHALGLGFLFALATSSSVHPAHAQASPPKEYPICKGPVSTADSEAAHTKYLAGKVDYDEAKYDSAISRFLNAYTLDCTKHELLVIISRAYEQSGDKAEAIRALEVYLERAPANTPDASNYRNRLENLRKALAEEKARAASSAPSGESPTGASPSPSTPAPAADVRGHTVAPWIVVGVGGLAVLAGGGLVLLGSATLPSNCELSTEKCTRQPGQSDEAFEKDREKAGEAKGFQTGGFVSLAAGGALVVGGLLWHFLEPTGQSSTSARADPKRNLAVLPELAPGYGGVALGGRF